MFGPIAPIRLAAAAVAAGLVSALLAACGPSPAMPGPPPGVDPLASVPAGHRLSFPSGPALLRVWGHSFLTNGPYCGPVLGTAEGSSVGAMVMVEADEAGWTVRLDPHDEVDGLELRITPAGRTVAEGEVLTGTARGVMRDTFAVVPAAPRNLRVDVSVEGPAVLEGLGTTARPYFQGTLTGHIRYADPNGGLMTCPGVYWSLWPVTPLPAL